MLKKDKIKVKTNPFNIRIKVQKDKETDEKVKTPEPPRLQKAFIHYNDLYKITYLERVLSMCRKNGVSTLNMPGGLSLTFHVDFKPALVKRFHKLTEDELAGCRDRAQKARDAMKIKRQKQKETKVDVMKEAQAEASEMSYEDTLFWSSTPGGTEIT